MMETHRDEDGRVAPVRERGLKLVYCQKCNAPGGSLP